MNARKKHIDPLQLVLSREKGNNVGLHVNQKSAQLMQEKCVVGVHIGVFSRGGTGSLEVAR